MFKILELSNGIQVALEENPVVRSISLGIWIKNGSRNEHPYLNGISHFIEHMLFKGTTNYTAREIADGMDSIGGQINAYTSKECTCYYTRMLDTHFDIAAEYMSDMLKNPLFAPEDIQKEGQVIIEEINMYEDTPEDLVHDIMQKKVWLDNPVGQPVIGTVDTVTTFDRNIINAYYNSHYHPKNITISVAGHFDNDKMIESLEKYFGDHKTNNYADPEHTKPIYTPSICTANKDIEQFHVVLGFPGIPRNSDDNYNLSVLNTILGGGMSSRLFQKVREENALAYSIYSYITNFSNAGMFSIYVGLAYEHLDEVMSLILAETEQLRNKNITATELKRSKAQIKSNYIMSLESTGNRMSSMGKSLTLLDKVLTAEEVIEKIDAVSLDRMRELSEQIFDKNQMSISLVGNTDNNQYKDILSKYTNLQLM